MEININKGKTTNSNKNIDKSKLLLANPLYKYMCMRKHVTRKHGVNETVNLCSFQSLAI